MSNFWARTITGLTMVFVILATLFFTRLGFAALFLLVTVLGLLEFYTVAETSECKPQKITGTILGTAGYLLTTWVTLWPATVTPSRILAALIPFLFIPFIAEMYRKKEKPLLNVAVTITGLIYIALPLSLLNILNDSRGGTIFGHFAAYLTAYFLITWIYDTGAYLVGKNFGRHKFFERISPKKTWEGTVGGFVVAGLASVALYSISDGISLVNMLVLTGLVVVFGSFGDLAESLFKRSLNLKDSGTILPGHGGIMDRFDTLFISAPFVFLYFIIMITP
jgi:phosphatidate cytidylyltransferase